MGIFSIYDLAHTNYYDLKNRLGVIGAQLYAHTWGIDRSFLGETVKPNSKSIGNSQILDRDYTNRSEIEIVIREMGDQVATRLRQANTKAQVVSLWIGYSMGYMDEKGKSSFHQQIKVQPTHSSQEIIGILLRIFDTHYTNQIVRNVGVNTGNLVYTDALQLDLFSEPEEQLKDVKVDQVVDTIRKKYGFKSLVRAVSVLEGGRAIARSSLVGGHAGGMGGLEEGDERV